MVKSNIPNELIEEAKTCPGGWVYELKPEYRGCKEVPMEGFIGAWKVSNDGVLTGEFIPVDEF